MRIGIDARMLGKAQSGIGNYIEQLTSNIFQLDKENDYFIFLLEPNYSQYQVPHNKIHKVKVTSRWYSYSEQTKFLAELLKYKLDLIHFPHFNAPLFYPGKRITTIHDITPYFFPGHKQKLWWHKMAYRLTMKNSLKKSSQIMTISEHTKADLIKYFKADPAKITVSYLGIEKQFQVNPNYDKIKPIKERLSLTKPFLFFVSVWRNHKNFQGLIKAFELLKQDPDFNYQLVLAGQEDPHYPDIRQAIEQSAYKNEIITPGFVSDEDLVSLYQSASLFVIPSFYEGFGLIGLEAMACGTPVVSSNVTSLPEIMGQASRYFDPKQTDQMAAVIKQVLSDEALRKNLIQKGLTRVQKYSWQQCAQETLTAYQKILSNQ